MKRTLSFMVMAFALLFTQCRKPEVKFPSPVAPEGTTVSMTITAGPGSKTDITTAGHITWSAGDRIYVGDGTHYVGYLTLQGTGGDATGTFTGNVTVTPGTYTFHFFYLGNAEDYSLELKEGTSTSVPVDFSSQNIYAEGGKLKNANRHHVGYGTASGEVDGDAVVGLNVEMKSKVAIAYFHFESGETPTPYEGALTLSGDHIYSSMTVGFGGTFSPGTKDNISLAVGHAQRYVMLVPPANVASETLNFSGGATGSTTFENGIEANKFYRINGNMPIEVKVKKGPFTVDEHGTTVEFSPGNLWYGKADGESTAAFHFEANQWSTTPASNGTWDQSHVSHFFWSNTTDWQESDKEPYASSYSYSTLTTSDVFFTEAEGFHVGNETGWRTLSNAEWSYLIGESNPGRAKSLREWSAVRFGESGPTVNGLIIMPDGWEGALTATTDYTTWQSLESSGAVFLPSVGYRDGTDVSNVGSDGSYWSSTSREDYQFGEGQACYMGFSSSYVKTNLSNRCYGGAVRLVR